MIESANNIEKKNLKIMPDHEIWIEEGVIIKK